MPSSPSNIIGFILAILGNTLIACSLTLQKRAHNNINANAANADANGRQSILRDRKKREQQHIHQSNITDLQPAVWSPSALSDLDMDTTNATNSLQHAASVPCAGSKCLTPCVNNHQPIEEIDHAPGSNGTEPSGSETTTTASTTTTAENSTNTAQGSFAFLRNKIWWAGTCLIAAGEVGNFAAFAFAPAALVAPLGAWSVVLSALLAHWFLSELASVSNIFGIVLCVVGAVLIGATGPDVSAYESNLTTSKVLHLLERPPFVLYMVLTICATIVLVGLSHCTALGERYVAIYIGVSSLLGGVTVVCAKALSTFIKLSVQGPSQFQNWLPIVLLIVLVLAIVIQLRYLNLAMSRFGNSQVVPIYYVLFTICALTSSVIMYREFSSLQPRNIPFFFGIACTMIGVFFVARGPAPVDEGYIMTPDSLPLSMSESDPVWGHFVSEIGSCGRLSVDT